MKAASDVLRDRPRIPLTVTRDSVCAGDDCDAPHEKLLEGYSFLDPAAFAGAVSHSYLPSVSGVGHTWTCTLCSPSFHPKRTKRLSPKRTANPCAGTNCDPPRPSSSFPEQRMGKEGLSGGRAAIERKAEPVEDEEENENEHKVCLPLRQPAARPSRRPCTIAELGGR